MRTYLLAAIFLGLFSTGTKAQWNFQNIGNGTKPIVEYTSTGVAYISFLTETNIQGDGFVMVATVSNGLVSTETARQGYFLGPADLALSINNVPAIAVHDVESNGNDPNLAGDAIVGQKIQGNWFFQTISDPGFDGRDPSITRDINDKFQIISVDVGNGIEHSFQDSNDVWISEIIDPVITDFQYGTDITVDAMNNIHVCYGVASDSTLRYASNANGTWNIEQINTHGRQPAMVLRNGTPTIAFYEPMLNNDGTYGTGGNIRLATRQGDSIPWAIETIGSIADIQLGPQAANHLVDMDMDDNGILHVAYSNPSIVIYAQNQNTNWTLDTVADVSGTSATLGSQTSIALTPDNVPTIGYYEINGISGTILFGTNGQSLVSQPTITCPSDTTITCEMATDPAVTGMATADNSASITFSDMISQDCPSDQVIERTWVATSGMDSVSCVQMITIQNIGIDFSSFPTDTITFSDVCPSDVGGMLTDAIELGCSGTIDTMSLSRTSESCDQIIYTRRYSVSDECSDTSFMVSQVILVENFPIIVIDSQTIVQDMGDSTGSISISASCMLDSLSFLWSDGSTDLNRSLLSAGTYSLTVTSQMGCIDSFQFEVSSFARTLTCPPDTVLACGSGTTPGDAGMIVAVGYASTSFTDVTVSDCPADLVIERTWLGIIDSLAADTCIQMITVMSNSTMASIESDTINFDGLCISEIQPMLSDSISLGCNEVVDTIIMVTTASTCMATEMTRTWTITNSCLDTTYNLSQIINATNVPVAKISNTVVTADTGSGNGSIAYDIDCSQDSLTFIWSNGSTDTLISNLDAGDYSVTITSNDGCVDSISFTVNSDMQGFSISCPPDTIINCEVIIDPELLGMPTIIGFDSVAFVDSIIQGCPMDIIIERQWTAFSDSFPSLSCTQTITVLVDSIEGFDLADTIRFDGICFDDLGMIIEEALNLPCNVFIDSVGIQFDSMACEFIQLTASWRFEDQCRDTTLFMDQVILVTNPIVINLENLVVTADSGRTDGSIFFMGTCQGDSISYAWSDGSTDSTRTGLAAGDYSLTVTNQDGCVDSFQFIVESAAPTLTCPADIEVSCDSATDPSVTGMATFTRFDSVTFSDSISGGCPSDLIILRTWVASLDEVIFDTCVQTITVKADGLENVSFIDTLNLNGLCVEEVEGSLTDSITLSCNQVLDTTIIEVTDLICGEAELTRTWTVTDNCLDTTVNFVQVIVVTDLPVITLDSEEIMADMGDSTGSITLSTSQCVGFLLEFAWSNGDSTKDISGLVAGNYNLTVTNSSNCVDSFSFTVPFEGPVAVINCPADTSVSCMSATDPSITGSASSEGFSGIRFVDEMVDNCPTGMQINRLWIGTTADSSFMDTCMQVISILNDGLSLSSADSSATLSGVCIDESMQALSNTISLACGSTIDTILVSIDTSGCDFAEITRTIRIQDECVGGSVTFIQKVSMTNIPPISLENIVVEPDRGDSMGIIRYDISCEIGDLAFDWSNGAIDQNLAELSAGNYALTITNESGCEQNFSFDVPLDVPSDSARTITINVTDRSGAALAIDSIAFIANTGRIMSFTEMSSDTSSITYILDDSRENLAFVCPSINDAAIAGLSVADIIRGQRYILQLSEQCIEDGIAGDVNFSGNISGVDLVLMRRILVGLDNSYPSNRTWSFVSPIDPATQPDNPGCVPVDADSKSSGSLDIMGIKLGDYQCPN